MYAVIESGGKQYRVQPGEKVLVEKLNYLPNEKVTFPVLMVTNGDQVRVGTPTLAGAQVIAEVLAEEKGKKLIVFKMKRRKGYRRKNGHRQIYTSLKILDIQG